MLSYYKLGSLQMKGRLQQKIYCNVLTSLYCCFSPPFLPHFLPPSILQVFDLHSGPKPVVFVLHSFLSAKLTRMGLLTWNNQQQQCGWEDGPSHSREGEDAPKMLAKYWQLFFCFVLMFFLMSFGFLQLLHSLLKLGPEVALQGRFNPGAMLLIVSKMCLLFQLLLNLLQS